MKDESIKTAKEQFLEKLKSFASTVAPHISTDDG